jgi:hypothetical protein
LDFGDLGATELQIFCINERFVLKRGEDSETESGKRRV